VKNAWSRGDRLKERTRKNKKSISGGRKDEEETRAQPWTSLGKERKKGG
jgi:hypothetical protein